MNNNNIFGISDDRVHLVPKNKVVEIPLAMSANLNLILNFACNEKMFPEREGESRNKEGNNHATTNTCCSDIDTNL